MDEDEDLQEELCPECGAEIVLKWSGIACSECDWWFCF